ncbi:MAG: small subunit ribosomal protein S18 [Candidatus Berkelbacteria bacterium Gr01-1014_85]|uniref:Small ribosomal subunit protein bS18 n=1 Tax=Candidatus Berkelbacteria bacterium Gr01-1014_85 TaxID=2017150 RepID=A0A554JDD3_9BACT|nr:MAG: small subunit ribosomal protein S18 [Candidatus Berkelbacteria bacterium Gr01-1014_85]
MKKKECQFCKRKVVAIDYKDASILTRYISSWSKIKSGKDSGACAKHQRLLTQAIKRARFMALIPYVSR